MNYYLFSLIIGIISTIIYYIVQKHQERQIKKTRQVYTPLSTRETYIKVLISNTLLSLISIYGYLYLNNMPGMSVKTKVPILTGKPNF